MGEETAVKGMRSVPEDTIAAISTPPGEGGVGIVRLSGPDAIAIAGRVFVSSRGKDPRSGRGRVFHGEVKENGLVLDEVLLHVMRAPHSYTREDVVEINCHAGAGPLNAVLELVLREGARLAGPGEFTKRAFLNGRIDLPQAEAVIDRIHAQTRAGLRAASASARGALSAEIGAMKDTLVELKAIIESAIDFADQELPELITPELHTRATDALARMKSMLATADAGRLYREGASVAIVGKPNVGKSSLFNALLRESRAIVTAQPGTTRDLLHEIVTIKGIPVRLTDTAGLRETSDEVESLGVAAARQALEEAAAILFVMDTSDRDISEDRRIAKQISTTETPCLIVANKIDLMGQSRQDYFAELSLKAVETIWVSAKTGKNLDRLEEALGNLLLRGVEFAPDQGHINRVHQKDSLRRAADALERLLADMERSPELLAFELDEALRALGEITGETTPDDVLDRIFSAFCIGK